MTRECLIFGRMRSVCISDIHGNEKLILQLREELKVQMPGDIGFDLLLQKDGIVLLDFIYDKRDTMSDDKPINAEITKLLTGEGVDGLELEHPLLNPKEKGMFNEKYFLATYLKNNKAYGGDNVAIKIISITTTHMLIELQFEV